MNTLFGNSLVLSLTEIKFSKEYNFKAILTSNFEASIISVESVMKMENT